MNILHILANPKPTEESVSKQLAMAFFTKLAETGADADISTVDLYQNPPPFYSYDTYKYFWYPIFVEGYKPSDAENKAAGYARAQVELFNKADVLVLTMPMWNFTIPAIMKAWMDQVLAPNGVFMMTPDGVGPLHHVKHVVAFVASGGAYKEGDARDALAPQLRAAFSFVGIEEVSLVWADGQNTLFYKDSDQRKGDAIAAAQELAEEIAADATAPASAVQA